jgi:hypothetical protein
MEYTEKAVLDSVQGANLAREDLSNTLSVTDGPQRPVTQGMEQVPARNKLHQWNEQGLNTAGRANVAAGGATAAEGALPIPNAKASVRKSNLTCRTSRLAQVTDTMMAEFNGGGKLQLAQGVMEELVQDALDLETALVLIEVLNQIEWMHISGDSTNATMEGGESDGLVKWIGAGGTTVATGGTDATPVNFVEGFIKDGARTVALTMPTAHADTLLVPPELIPDINATVANGAGRPIVVQATAENTNIVAGQSVDRYNTGFSTLRVKEEPYLSPTYNTAMAQPAILAFNKALVKQANLIGLRSELMPRTDMSIKRAVVCEYTQEHRIAKHTWIAKDIKSAIA